MSSTPTRGIKLFADQAFFAVGSGDIAPFLLKKDAEAYAAKIGGKVLGFDDAVKAAVSGGQDVSSPALMADIAEPSTSHRMSPRRSRRRQAAAAPIAAAPIATLARRWYRLNRGRLCAPSRSARSRCSPFCWPGIC